MGQQSNDLISFQPQETEVTAAMSSDQLVAYQDRILAGMFNFINLILNI